MIFHFSVKGNTYSNHSARNHYVENAFLWYPTAYYIAILIRYYQIESIRLGLTSTTLFCTCTSTWLHNDYTKTPILHFASEATF